MIRGWRLAFAAASLVLGLTGCWDRTEVNDLAFVMAMAIDKAGAHAIEVSAQIFIPRSSGGGGGGGGGEMQAGQGAGGSTLVRSATGSSIGDALGKLQEQIPRTLFLGHDEVYILGEQVARGGITDHVDFLARSSEPRKRAYVFISTSKGKEMLMNQPRLERSSAEVVREMAELKTGMSVTIKDLELQLSGQSGTAVLPLLQKLPPESAKSDQSTIHYIRGVALIKKGKLVGTMDDSLTRGVLWIRNELDTANITFPAGGKDGGTASVRSIKNNVKLIPEIQNGQMIMNVVLKAETYLIQNTSKMNPMNPKFNQQLESQLNLTLEKRIRQTLHAAQQKWNTDIFGFADAIHRKYPGEWRKMKEQWDEIFPKLQVAIHAQAEIQRSGSIGGSTAVPSSEVINP
ncbi:MULTISPECIES: Ger(x)C family spore germination protein [Paenibacillus]|uniref:Ger(x)C family spore germination protein n=1 Tax=Paenibacillus TaxID=44249 RepID=UPI0022B92D05|nr:Ger(x)C family spore germination protein [Paenibacillus caseinilyticus]MCZ8522593.1 Ger(x)C family spore germination protein [Paenibacillus caseinilyticus]